MARILLVEDDDQLRDAMEFLLSSVGYTIVEAGNGQEALERAEGTLLDLVITDLQMPIMDGIELIKALVLDSPEQKIIAMTAKTGITATDNLRASQALSSGASEVIHKPFNTHDFLDRIEFILDID